MKYSEAKAIWDARSPTYDDEGSVIYSPEELAALDVFISAKSRVAELKKMLSDTDYKDLPNYQPKNGEDIASVVSSRNAWREEIRDILAQIGDSE